ncbi:MAG: hypothetical protein CVU00_00805 [Bacteroidetes bacterium HGW-Bacteroidetes-17]|nr:MAG: hypothetical protein CVU00_00805 [Bacteroidetes bacterium HGW-Bacteroidetes-17]
MLGSLYLIFLTGFFRGGSFEYVLTDLRGKLPLLVFPLIIVGMPTLSKKKLNVLLLFFVAAVLSGTIFSAIELFGRKFIEIRDISVFISPVRFGLMICFAIVILLGFIFVDKLQKQLTKMLFATLVLWFLFILIKLESGMGILILSILTVVFSIRELFKSGSIVLKIVFSSLLISSLIAVWIFINNELDHFYTTPKIEISQLEKTTTHGNAYLHDTINYGIEDGKYIGLYLCEDELKEAWEARSSYDFDGLDEKRQALRSTLIRFLTSRGLYKDKEGVRQLTNEEIGFIEGGIANSNYIYKPGIRSRISKILFGYEVYQKTADPNGNSLVQRIEYWTASINIIKENFWWGAGTGNIPHEFEAQYNEMNSKLSQKNRMESHNQYLLVMISLGILGFIWFIFALIYPGIKTRAFSDYRYLAFLLIILISMLTEDTIETQTGVTFFAFFNTIFLLNSKDKSK